jgi:hypothetical protein
LSSPAERAGARLTFLRGVPLPLCVTRSRQNLGLMQVVCWSGLGGIKSGHTLRARCGLVGRSESGEIADGRGAAANVPMRAEAPSFLSRS